MFHLIAYYESIDPAAAATAIAAVQDPTINTTGDDVRMSAALPSIAGCTALTASAAFTSAQLRAPSLRTLNNLDIRPLVNAVTFGDPPQPMMFPRNVRPVVPAEDLQAFVTSTPAGGAEAHYALVWLADAALPQVNGAMFTVGASSASTLTAGNWVNSNITFDQTLPSGSYQVVGMRAEGANLVAARLVFPGAGANSWRPGVPGCNTAADLDPEYFRFGGMGIYGTFNQDNPPTIDGLGVTDTAQTLTLDLIKVG
jgi:hypothetical protein|tara:strand:- start:1010 stop:1774 length:765 start_codon:yes stop_codon:yes gene_type:complete